MPRSVGHERYQSRAEPYGADDEQRSRDGEHRDPEPWAFREQQAGQREQRERAEDVAAHALEVAVEIAGSATVSNT